MYIIWLIQFVYNVFNLFKNVFDWLSYTKYIPVYDNTPQWAAPDSLFYTLPTICIL